MEVSYRKHLYLPAAMEVHPVNDQAHGKMEQWAPDSEKMLAELEGNRMSKSLNVSPAKPSLLPVGSPPDWPLQVRGHALQPALQSRESRALCVQLLRGAEGWSAYSCALLARSTAPAAAAPCHCSVHCHS